jgi:hypothetical protein
MLVSHGNAKVLLLMKLVAIVDRLDCFVISLPCKFYDRPAK